MASPKSKLFLFAFYMALTSPSMEAARPLHQSTDPNPNFEPSIAEGDFYSDPNRSFPTAPGAGGLGHASSTVGYGDTFVPVGSLGHASSTVGYGDTFGSTSATNYGGASSRPFHSASVAGSSVVGCFVTTGVAGHSGNTYAGVAGYGGAYGPVNGVINRYYIPK
ncbi:hypothetical protein CCACVL1_00230 [Corchorus capsularis]|uniref:Uncharacterized protein n=1 Tax=Corchorus capsularis TaxID=210143 RepID=A0A1R3KXQ5_COCAP|nr:hypothetical protein CCACVL1_00230 [Corchorus capsularis]